MHLKTLLKSLFSEVTQFTGSPQNEQGKFIRLEDKYLLTEAQAKTLIPLLKQNLNVSSPVPDTEFTIIESVYFDSTDLSVLKEYLSRPLCRSKMRTRRYAPNGNRGSDVFIELKNKEGEVCNKSRFQITNPDEARLLLGYPLSLTEDLLSANPKITPDKLTDRMERVNDFISRLKTVPAAKVTYSRLAFEKDQFRVTIDSDVRFENYFVVDDKIKKEIASKADWMRLLSNAQKSFRDKKWILEVKHSHNVPLWMKQFITENNLTEHSFSKYSYAMSFAVAGSLMQAAETAEIKISTMREAFQIFTSMGSEPVQQKNKRL